METAHGQSCHRSSFVLPSATSGYIGNLLTIESGKGSPDCPWIIQGRQGQQINITLMDFARSSPTTTNLVVAPDHDDVCQVYAVIRERLHTRTETVCSVTDRQKHVFTSVGHAIELRIRGGGIKEDPKHFLLRYESEWYNKQADNVLFSLKQKMRHIAQHFIDRSRLYQFTCFISRSVLKSLAAPTQSFLRMHGSSGMMTSCSYVARRPIKCGSCVALARIGRALWATVPKVPLMMILTGEMWTNWI